MQLVVQLKPKYKTPSTSIKTAVRESGATLEPMHPGATDPTLRTFFTAEVESRETAERLASLLLQNAAVEAAYVKSADALP